MQNKQIKTKRKVNISKYLTLHIQAQADEFVEAFSKQELSDAVKYAIGKDIPYFVIGGGSNTALKTTRFSGLIIKNNYISKKIIKETPREVFISVSSGYPMPLLVNEAIESGWEGLEYHKGLPGTVGGGIYMNSKWTRPMVYVSDCLIEATLIGKNGEEKKVTKDYLNFSYGYSLLQDTGEIVLDAIFRLKKMKIAILKQRARDSLSYRKKTQPFGVSTCGCFFKNITEDEMEKAGLKTKSAGYLIDKCGLKGLTIGSFIVSDMHANFIINKDNKESNPNDLLQLVSLIKREVKNKFNVELKEEVRYLY